LKREHRDQQSLATDIAVETSVAVTNALRQYATQRVVLGDDESAVVSGILSGLSQSVGDVMRFVEEQNSGNGSASEKLVRRLNEAISACLRDLGRS
jgi:predicted thioredoxin/glutaredoxin